MQSRGNSLMSKRVTATDGAFVKQGCLVEERKDKVEITRIQDEARAQHVVNGSLASTAAQERRKTGTGKLQTSGRLPSTKPEAQAAASDPSEPDPPSPNMVEQIDTKKRNFEQVCMLSRNPNDEENEFDFPECADEHTPVDVPVYYDDSIVSVLTEIGLLQARITALRNQLKASMYQKPVRPIPRSVAVRFKSAGGNLTAKGGSHAAPRRRASDYDINNVVMPVSVGAKYVEHIRHENIETPKWRLVETPADVAESSSSSENENTDDEAYSVRHAELEARERRLRLPVPNSNKKTSDGPKSKPRSKQKSKFGRVSRPSRAEGK